MSDVNVDVEEQERVCGKRGNIRKRRYQQMTAASALAVYSCWVGAGLDRVGGSDDEIWHIIFIHKHQSIKALHAQTHWESLQKAIEDVCLRLAVLSGIPAMFEARYCDKC